MSNPNEYIRDAMDMVLGCDGMYDDENGVWASVGNKGEHGLLMTLGYDEGKTKARVQIDFKFLGVSDE